MDDRRTRTIDVESLYRSKLLSQFPGIVHAFSTRQLGNMSCKLGDSESARSGRQRLAAALTGGVTQIITTRSVHGTSVGIVDGRISTGNGQLAERQFSENCDGLVTNQVGLALATSFADCLPVLLYDPGAQSIGLVHAGWRGVVAGIVTCAIDRMTSRLDSRPDRLVAYVGPSIHSCCFEVQDDVWQAFASQPYADAVTISRGGKRFIDMQSACEWQLKISGLRPTNVEISSACTCCDSVHFYSHRRDGVNRGAMAAMIALVNDRIACSVSAAA